MSEIVIDGLRLVLQNLRLQDGAMAKVQADYVRNAIKEIERLNAVVAKNQPRPTRPAETMALQRY